MQPQRRPSKRTTKRARFRTLSAAIDRARVQLEASSDPQIATAWALILAGLEVHIDRTPSPDVIR